MVDSISEVDSISVVSVDDSIAVVGSISVDDSISVVGSISVVDSIGLFSVVVVGLVVVVVEAVLGSSVEQRENTSVSCIS